MAKRGVRRISGLGAVVVALALSAACSTSEGSDLTVDFVNVDGLVNLTSDVSVEDDDFNFEIPVAGTSRTFDVDVGHVFVIQIHQGSATNFRNCTVTQDDLDDGTVEFLILSNGDGGLGELTCW